MLLQPHGWPVRIAVMNRSKLLGVAGGVGGATALLSFGRITGIYQP